MITYYHKLDPFLIQFSGNYGIRWYSLAYIAGAVFAYFIGIYLIKKGRIQLDVDKLMDAVGTGALGAVLGGRLGYCAFYRPDLFVSFDISFPYWGLLKIHEGGLSSHGGIIGFLLFQALFAYRHKLSFFSLMDLGSIAGAAGIFLGRIANFINGELYGRIVEGTTWLAVRFPSELYLWASQPSLYKEQLLSLKKLLPVLQPLPQDPVGIPKSYVWENWVVQAVEGDFISSRKVSHICGLIVENAHQEFVQKHLEPLLFLRYPSQLYQSLLGGLATFLIICLFWLTPRKAGVIALVWASSYLLFRVFTEFYRQPDSHIGLQVFNLTRGQWLSLSLYLIVIIYGYFVYKQKPKGFGKLY